MTTHPVPHHHRHRHRHHILFYAVIGFQDLIHFRLRNNNFRLLRPAANSDSIPRKSQLSNHKGQLTQPYKNPPNSDKEIWSKVTSSTVWPVSIIIGWYHALQQTSINFLNMRHDMICLFRNFCKPSPSPLPLLWSTLIACLHCLKLPRDKGLPKMWLPAVALWTWSRFFYKLYKLQKDNYDNP